MANAQMYAPRLGKTPVSLKSRLGFVSGTAQPVEVVADNEDNIE